MKYSKEILDLAYKIILEKADRFGFCKLSDFVKDWREQGVVDYISYKKDARRLLRALQLHGYILYHHDNLIQIL